jgi:hypothetical protein
VIFLFSHRVTCRRPFDPFGELRAGNLRAMAGQAENTEFVLTGFTRLWGFLFYRT